MKTIHIPTAALAGISLATLTTGALAINHYQNKPKPEATVPVSQVAKARELAYADSALTVQRLRSQLITSDKRLTATIASKTAACKRLTTAKIVAPECK
jgi:hypothetical protein